MNSPLNVLETLNMPLRFRSPFDNRTQSKFSPVAEKQKRIREIFLLKEDKVRPFELNEESNNRYDIFKEDITEVEEKENEEEEDPSYFIRKRSNSHLKIKRKPFLNLLSVEKNKVEKNEHNGFNILDIIEPKKGKRRKDVFNFKKFCLKRKKKKELIQLKTLNRRNKEKERIVKQPTKDQNLDDLKIKEFFDKNKENRLGAKIKKVRKYWLKKSLMIPNALQLTHCIQGDEKNLVEFQDYSKKSVLIHSPKKKIKLQEQVIDKEEEEECNKSIGERSFHLVLNDEEEEEFFHIN